MEDPQPVQYHIVNDNFESMNYSGTAGKIPKSSFDQQLDEQNRMKEEKIRQLKRTIAAYQKNSVEQTKQLQSMDNLVIENNSLNKNYIEVENLLNQTKLENARLNEIIKAKMNTISDYQKVMEMSKQKFQMYDHKFSEMNLQIQENETKLKTLPGLLNTNAELNQKINAYEARLQNLKNEQEKKDELFKVKIANIEKLNKSSMNQYEDEIAEFKINLNKVKLENDKLKTQLSDITEQSKDNELMYKKKLNEKEKEIERLSKALLKLQNETAESNLTTKEKNINYEKTISELGTEISNLNTQITERDSQINQLNNACADFEATVTDLDNKLKSQDSTIGALKDEKEKLSKQLMDKQSDFVDYQNSSQKEKDILHQKLIMIDKEYTDLKDKYNSLQDDNNNLQERIGHFETDSKMKENECREFDKKYNALAQTLEIKEDEFQNEYEKYSAMLTKKQNEIDILRTKYDKKVQMLKLENEQLNSRMKNLINTLCTLKDYAIGIERNMKDTTSNYGGNLNNSMYTTMPYSGTYTIGDDNNRYSRQLINGLKSMISKIDSKLLYEK